MNSRRSNAAPARSHPRVSGDLEICRRFDIPACAGMTGSDLSMSSLLWSLVLLVLLTMAPAAHAGKISLSIQELDLDIREVMQMLSREQRLNIFVADGVSGDVSVNLYDMETDQVVKLIAESAGFVVEQRDNSYFVIERDDAGKLRRSDRLEVRSFRVQYAATSEIETIFQEYVSAEFGSIKALQDNNLLVVEDLPSFLDRMEALLEEIDREPRQIMIEAKILEISLTDNQSYGLDWAKLFTGQRRLGGPVRAVHQQRRRPGAERAQGARAPAHDFDAEAAGDGGAGGGNRGRYRNRLSRHHHH
jgi:type II secretory pathway component GspD/PulD (secretin)